MEHIKLIVTDMDGTFLNSSHEMSPEFSDVYKELKKRNILFVPQAEGRCLELPIISGDIESEIGFIAENGGYVVYKDQELFADTLEYEHIVEIIKTVREIPGAKAVLSAKKYAYYETDDQQFVDFFSKYYTQNMKKDDLTEKIDDTAFKIAVYHPDGSEKYLYPALKKFEDLGLEVVISGAHWLDVMNKDINKGNALKILQKSLGISSENTMAFGDYMNDIEMLKNAKYSYAMKNAHPHVKQIANFEASTNDSFGVLKTIKDFLQLN